MSAADHDDQHLILDELSERLDTLKIFRADDDERANAVLEQFGAQGKVESEMLDQLAFRAPLRFPDRFEEAHRTAMRALEIFDRNAGRAPSTLRLGALENLVKVPVKLLIRVVVRNYQKTVIEDLSELYARREAASVRGSRDYHMLRMARQQVDRLVPGYASKSVGLPAFLVGGAVLSWVLSVLRAAIQNPLVLFLLSVVVIGVALGGFWCILKAAAIARRRTRIALDAPLRALWQTIGGAGNPPKDQSRRFVVVASVLLALAWIIVPVALVAAYHSF